MVLSNRSTVSTVYTHSMADGTEIYMTSSRGNEAITKKARKAIGRDVVTNNVITYTSYKAIEGGMELSSIVKIDPCGMIPNWVKVKASAMMAGHLR